MVEVFKTNVEEQEQAAKLVEVLIHHFPLSRINFDLDDCDRILRVEGDTVSYKEIIELITVNGYQCKILE